MGIRAEALGNELTIIHAIAKSAQEVAMRSASIIKIGGLDQDLVEEAIEAYENLVEKLNAKLKHRDGIIARERKQREEAEKRDVVSRTVKTEVESDQAREIRELRAMLKIADADLSHSKAYVADLEGVVGELLSWLSEAQAERVRVRRLIGDHDDARDLLDGMSSLATELMSTGLDIELADDFGGIRFRNPKEGSAAPKAARVRRPQSLSDEPSQTDVESGAETENRS